MRCFFYCSYEGSRKGYVLTQLCKDLPRSEDGNPVLPEEGAEVSDDLSMPYRLVPLTQADPASVYEFFSYDRLRFLWLELQQTGTFLGVRGIRGRMKDGRTAYSNLVLLGKPGEEGILNAAALEILRDWKEFEGFVSGCLTADDDPGHRDMPAWIEPGYLLDERSFLQWLYSCPPAENLHRQCGMFSLPAKVLSNTRKNRKPLTVEDGLRLAVCRCPKQTAVDFLQRIADLLINTDPAKAQQNPWMHEQDGCRTEKDLSASLSKNRFILEADRFTTLFVEKAPLWST